MRWPPTLAQHAGRGALPQVKALVRDERQYVLRPARNPVINLSQISPSMEPAPLTRVCWMMTVKANQCI